MNNENNAIILQKIKEQLEKELERQGIEVADLTESEISQIVEKTSANIFDIMKKRRNASYKNRISREARAEVKERIIHNESEDVIRQGMQSKLSTTQIDQLLKEYEVLGLIVQAMPYDDITKRVIERKDGESEADFEKRYSRQRIYCSQIASREQVIGLIQGKRSEIEKRLREGVPAEDIVQDQQLNVCREVVLEVQRKIDKENESKKDEKSKITPETRQKILNLLLSGKTPEEIHAMPEFEMLEKEQITKIQKQEQIRILAIQLVDVQEIADQIGVHKSSVYANCKNYEIDGKSISQIREEKKNQIIQRLQAGETPEEIAKDPNIFVSPEALKDLAKALEKKQKSEKKQSNKELKEKAQAIFELYAVGKTPEEVQAMKEYSMFSLEDLQELQDRNKIRLLYLQLVDKEEIAASVGIKPASVYQNVKLTEIGGKSIVEVAREKRKQIKQRLQAGETVDEISADKTLFVSRKAVQDLAKSLERNPNTEKKQSNEELNKKAQAIFELYATGKTPEEVQAMEEYSMFSLKDLQGVQDRNKVRLLYLQLVSNEEIINQTGLKTNSIYTNIYAANIQGKRIPDVAREKREIILSRLQAGETVDMIIQDKSIFVCKEAVLKLAKKVKPAKPEKPEKASKPQSQKMPEATGANQEYKPKGFDKVVSTAESPEERKRNIAHFKMKKMKAKYEKVWRNVSDEQEESQQKQVQSPEEAKRIQEIIARMEQKLKQLEDAKTGKKEKVEILRDILKDGNSILKYNFTLEQAEKFSRIFTAKSMVDYRKGNPPTEYRTSLEQMVRNANRKLAQIIRDATGQANDLATLEQLKAKLPPTSLREDIGIEGVRMALSNKIQKARTDLAIWKMRNEVLPEMHEIIHQVAAGEIDIARANQTIEQLAQKKVEGKPVTRFSLTAEQERKQFLMQIRNVLTERGEEYPIQNPESTMEILQELLGGNRIFNLRTIVKNQLGRKEFEAAKQTCSMIRSRELDDSEASQLHSLRREVRGVEVGDMILNAIQTESTIEEETRFWELLEEGIRLKNVPFQMISLGKTQDGSRDIMLKDVWPGDLRELQR